MVRMGTVRIYKDNILEILIIIEIVREGTLEAHDFYSHFSGVEALGY